MSMQDQGTAAPEAAGPVSTGSESATPVVEKSEGSAPTETTEQPKGPQETPKWAQQRIGELTRKNAREQTEKAELRARLAFYEQQARQQQQPSEQPQPSQPTNAPREPQTQQYDHEQVMSEATKVAEFNLRCNQVAEKGKAMPGFDGAMSTLAMTGLITPESLSAVLDASDAPEKVLLHLGSHPDEAAEILAMSPVRMAKAITRLEQSFDQKPVVSTAPIPLRPGKTGGEGSGPAVGTRAWFEAETKRDAERRR